MGTAPNVVKHVPPAGKLLAALASDAFRCGIPARDTISDASRNQPTRRACRCHLCLFSALGCCPAALCNAAELDAHFAGHFVWRNREVAEDREQACQSKNAYQNLRSIVHCRNSSRTRVSM